MRARWQRLAAATVGLLASVQASADPAASPIAKLGLQKQPVELPGAWHVVFAFLLVAAVAVAAALAVQRFAPTLVKRLSGRIGAVDLRLLGRQRLEPGVHAHVIEVGTERVLVVTSRAGVVVHPLAAPSESSTQDGAHS